MFSYHGSSCYFYLYPSGINFVFCILSPFIYNFIQHLLSIWHLFFQYTITHLFKNYKMHNIINPLCKYGAHHLLYQLSTQFPKGHLNSLVSIFLAKFIHLAVASLTGTLTMPWCFLRALCKLHTCYLPKPSTIFHIITNLRTHKVAFHKRSETEEKDVYELTAKQVSLSVLFFKSPQPFLKRLHLLEQI
jgi:hypothetical protein